MTSAGGADSLQIERFADTSDLLLFAPLPCGAFFTGRLFAFVTGRAFRPEGRHSGHGRGTPSTVALVAVARRAIDEGSARQSRRPHRAAGRAWERGGVAGRRLDRRGRLGEHVPV